MPCFVPLRAFKTAQGAIVFKEKGNDVLSQLWLPCGRCIGCKLERSRQWAMRCVHEASLHESNAFVTLTYDDAHLPYRSSLDYSHFQKFMKRLRKRMRVQCSFVVAGEYGDLNWRPHWHALLFGVNFSDSVPMRMLRAHESLRRSPLLEELWPFGHSSIGDVNFETAAYVGRYCTKKITGQLAESHYRRIDQDTGEIYHLTPEMLRCSNRRPIGKGWFERFRSDVYPHDYVVVRGKEMKPPKYYDTLLDREFPDVLEDVKFQREIDALENGLDNTFQRLQVKQQVVTAGLAQFRRNL